MTRASESGNRKLTAATERRAETQFRQFVKALPPGAIVEWFDMDFWVFVNFRDFTDDGQEDLTVVCMTAVAGCGAKDDTTATKALKELDDFKAKLVEVEKLK